MKTSNLVDYTVLGGGTPIVFLHGMALDKRSTSLFFEPVMRQSDWQRVYLDLPGMGQSAPTAVASSETLVEALIAAIHEIIGDQPFAVYGHSYGGYLAQALANRLPEQVVGLFLTGPVVKAEKGKRQLAEHQNIFLDTVQVDVNDASYEDFLKMNVQISQKHWEQYQKMILPGLAAINHRYLVDLHKHYTLAEEAILNQKDYQIPFTMMVGKNDQIVGYQDQCQLVEHSTMGELFLLNQTGHNLLIDQPELSRVAFGHFLETVKSYLASR
ncbi:alpha/beta fold hydrolase [Fructobacillus durionis]|uniref:Pimeloyl-ACP methyl ester carboxylesterase n=1 Tax=Fructobacillus durionis TaxID=283737 RepID=A0A1I1GGF2_9LACO|nr:alpha/beta hydrolase [Fructobacillus durionis]SFC10506.1 Pimeloyl-ACP methyl ester carboxylesterase [Fructobacillus durionis]